QSPKLWLPLSGIAIHINYDSFILFITEEELIVSRYTTIAAETRVIKENNFNSIINILNAEGWLGGTVGLEMWSYRPNRAVSDMFHAALMNAGCQVADGSDIVRKIRATKSPQELTYHETAARIADIGLQAAIDALRPGASELDIYAEITYAMAKAGGETPAIPPRVLSGSKSAGNHALASRRQIMPGDLVTIDLCGVYNRYHSNVGRTFSVGDPDPDVAHVLDLAAKAMDVVQDIIRPNLPVDALNRLIQAYYHETGIWDDRLWIGGYEMGLAFPPDWVGSFVYDPDLPANGHVFRSGTVVNYESNFYLPQNSGASMLVDTIIFGHSQAHLLSKIPYDLQVISA
ncbi:MAG: Xaa-Pro peptidase family protein, partial [Chloroflexota bacterium]